MGDRDVRSLHISGALVVLGAAALVAGVFGQFGPWWALITAGTLAVVGALLLIDVDEPDRSDRT